METKTKLPRYDELMNPVFQALKVLGGSGTNEEIISRIISDLGISSEDANVLHNSKTLTNQTELSYRVGWAKTYMEKFGIISNDEKKGLWSIKPEFEKLESVDKNKVIATYTEKLKKEKEQGTEAGKEAGQTADATGESGASGSQVVEDEGRESENPESEKLDIEDASYKTQPWRKQLLSVLQNMDPFAFEHLAQLLLSKCGFVNVKVTKRSGDGGIDGTGKLSLKDVFSINVAFQCKRYKGTVGSNVVRDFRGSLPSSIGQGVLITTGIFTDAAHEEAASPGKQQIDLMDREKLIDMLIKHGIGVREVTAYEVDQKFFDSL